jgi:hypothetical protein
LQDAQGAQDYQHFTKKAMVGGVTGAPGLVWVSMGLSQYNYYRSLVDVDVRGGR